MSENFRTYKILHVEDYSLLRSSYKARLELYVDSPSFGLEFFGANDVASSQESLLSNLDVDLAILDGKLLGDDHGRTVAQFIRDVIWPRQMAEDRELTAIMTLSADLYTVSFESAAYSKASMNDIFNRVERIGLPAWIAELKSKVPGQRSLRPIEGPDVNKGPRITESLHK